MLPNIRIPAASCYSREWLVVLGLTLVCLSSLVTGCQFLGHREAVSPAQVVQMSREKVAPDQIVQKIRDSQTVYSMNATKVKELLDQGVDPSVVDAMLNARMRDSCPYFYPPSYPYPYYFGAYTGMSYGFTVYQ